MQVKDLFFITIKDLLNQIRFGMKMLYLTEHAKSSTKDLKSEILIWKTTIQMHRESLMVN